jgi:hypothetical protein
MKILEAGLWSEPSGMKVAASGVASALTTGVLWSAPSAMEVCGTTSALGACTGAARAPRAVFSFLEEVFAGNSATDTEFFSRGDVSVEPLDPRDETRLWKRR